jgi:hypothetical protein
MIGGTVVGGNLFLQGGCKPAAEKEETLFSKDDEKLLDEIAETILPKTNTPGAKEAQVGSFMVLMVSDCYSPADQEVFKEGIRQVEKASSKEFGKGFMKIKPEDRLSLLNGFDKAQQEHQKARKDGEPAHFFRMMKELTLLGFFTSKPGATEALRYVAVPGRYDGCVDYNKGDRAWL